MTSVETNSPDDVHDAVLAAHDSLGGWKPLERSRLLSVLADALYAHVEEASWLESLSGKPISQASSDIHSCIECLRYYSQAITSYPSTVSIPYSNSRFNTFTVKEPIGVCGIITSFNYPLSLAIWKIAPALAAGNSVIIKPAEQTPLSTLFLASLSPFPAGVLNVVLGDASIGSALVKHPQVGMISFTGSTQTGKCVAQDAALLPKPCVLELGGKNSLIVCEDADLNLAVDCIMDGAFGNMGQNCCACSKVYIAETLYDHVVEEIKNRVAKLVVGNHSNPETDIGPLVNETQMNRVLGFITRSQERLLVGGNRVGSQGYLVSPTVYTHVDESCELAQEEIFGPVLAIMKPFKRVQEAIESANSTKYGLAAGIFTTSNSIAEMAVRDLKAGIVWVNHYNETPPWLPFGGIKASGYGKDLGMASLDHYLVTKSVMRRI